MGDESVKWLVKDRAGVVTGPFATSNVIKKIRTGFYVGEEQISLFPSGQWESISYEEDFFDALLKSLEDDMTPEESFVTAVPKSAPLEPPPKEKKTERDWGDAIVRDQDLDNKTNVKTAKDRQQRSILELHDNGRKGRAVEDQDGTKPAAQENKKSRAERKEKKRKAIEREKRRRYEAHRQKKASQRRFRNFVVVVLLVAIGFFLLLEEKPKVLTGERIHLLRPSFKKGRKKVSAGSFKKALAYFRADSSLSYRKSQQLLVSRVETKKDLRAYTVLCMTYKELWGESFQDSKDFQTVLFVLRRAQKMDPYSNAASVCQVVNQWVRGNYANALRLLEAKLLKDPRSVFFNQMAGDIYASRRDYSVAAYYFAKVREFWVPAPVWGKALIQEARMMRRLKRYSEAVTLYSALLKSYPRHAVGQIEKGILEFEVYQHIEKSKNHIRSGLSEGQKIPKIIESEAYFNLAKMNMVQGDRARALKNGKKAFSIDSTNQEARKLVISLGGIKALNSISIDNASLVYVGEQFMIMENYASAQAEFRAAYDANNKNAFAALRAGQALWKLNQGREAISWMQKSVLADPTFIRSYVILADYLSARYDFKNAIGALDQARKINKRHHEVWRGYALVELRRRNYSAAVAYGDRALKLYDTDVDALLILAKAHKALGDYDKSYQYIQQASELESSNEEVQATYAKILVELQGAYAGEVYLESLITQFPGKIIFRRTRGEILVEEERFDDAIDVFNEILAIRPKDKPTMMQMALVLEKKGEKEDFESAREYLTDAASLDPSDAKPLFLLGQLYLESNQAKSAQTQFDRVIQVNSKYPLAHYHSGLAALKMGDVEKALKMAAAEKRINPGLPDPHLLAGEAYFKKSFDKDITISSSSASLCADEYRDAITKGYVVAQGYIWLARCLRLTGALDEAESMLDEAEKLESGNPEIYKELGAIYEVKGAVDKAINWYQKYLRLSPQANDSGEIKVRIKVMDSSRQEAI